jgi:uncharacterized protein YlaI
MQKYGWRANEAASKDFKCIICNESAGFNYSDLHAEAMCNRCGTAYMLNEIPHKISIKENWIPILKQYWNETHQYMGLGQIVIWRDYPEAEEGRMKFNDWCKKHKDILPKE